MPQGFKGWAVWLFGQAVFTAIYKLIYKLVENALIGWGDDQIAAYFGITSPTASTVFSWLLPLALAGLTLWLYHLVQMRIAKHSPLTQFGGDRLSATVTVGDGLPQQTWIKRLEPHHLIILGLAIAVGGVIWQMNKASLQRVVTTVPVAPVITPPPATSVTNNPPASSPLTDPYKPGPILQRKLTRREAEYLAETLSVLKKAAVEFYKIDMPQDLLPPLPPTHPYQRVNWVEKIRKDGIDATINTLTGFKDRFSAADAELNKIISADPAYSEEMYRIVGKTGVGEIRVCLGRYISVLEELKKNIESPSSNLISIALAGVAKDCYDAADMYWKWRNTFSEQRLLAARREIESDGARL